MYNLLTIFLIQILYIYIVYIHTWCAPQLRKATARAHVVVAEARIGKVHFETWKARQLHTTCHISLASKQLPAPVSLSCTGHTGHTTSGRCSSSYPAFSCSPWGEAGVDGSDVQQQEDANTKNLGYPTSPTKALTNSTKFHSGHIGYIATVESTSQDRRIPTVWWAIHGYVDTLYRSPKSCMTRTTRTSCTAPSYVLRHKALSHLRRRASGYSRRSHSEVWLCLFVSEHTRTHTHYTYLHVCMTVQLEKRFVVHHSSFAMRWWHVTQVWL